MADLACAMCKAAGRVSWQKAGNFTLPLCINATACTERYKQRTASGSSGGDR